MKKVVALVGNPNSGKTTLFNRLTSREQAVGNWCGVTVELKRGFYRDQGKLVEVVDLPGCYYYSSTSEGARDEQITADYLNARAADVIINVIDATHLERHLYLTLQLLEHGFPVIVALNMMDAADKMGIDIDSERLAEHLGCSVVPLAVVQGKGLSDLKKAIHTFQIIEPKYDPDPIPPSSFEAQDEVEVAKARYDRIHEMTKACIRRSSQSVKTTWTERIDHIVLNRFLGVPLFLAAMYAVFVFAIHVAGIFQDFFDIASKTVFMEGVQQGLTYLHAPHWLISVMVSGVGQGINTTLSFVPVMIGMFLSLAFMEASGYMARAAFVMDKVMRWVGLPGKSFVPMIIGFGCNVPAVMATRTLDTYRERILTILMAPFMSCGARLTIYALFVSAFFPNNGQNIIFCLYLIGILVAMMTGLVLRNTVLKGERSNLVIELPPYRWPGFRSLWRSTWFRLKQFVVKAGTLIILLCVMIGILGAFQGPAKQPHWLENFGRSLTPIFSPMGIQEDNWPATVGLMTGVLAKEVVVGTLNALYHQEGNLEGSAGLQSVSVLEGLTLALESIPKNWARVGDSVLHPLLIDEPEEPIYSETKGRMVQQFGSTVAAFSYLLFVLLYFPCVSVVAAMARELNKTWAIFSVVWTTGIAYATAVLFYQIATFSKAPLVSVGWITGIFGVMAGAFYGLRRFIRVHSVIPAKEVPTPILVLDH